MEKDLFLAVSGMSCVNCARGIEKGLAKEEGITLVRVYLADETADIRFDTEKTSQDRILRSIHDLGYEGRILGAPQEESSSLVPLVFTAAFAFPVWYLGMFAEQNWPNLFSQMVLSGVILMTTGSRFFIGAARALKSRNMNMDVLVALGIGASWAYSTFMMMAPGTHHTMVYFETSAVLVLFILFGKTLEGMARHKAAESLKGLTSLQQGTVRRMTGSGGNSEELVDPALINSGDRVRVLPGERFLIDGTIESGESSADESLLTGETMPVGKKPGSEIFSGTVNLTGELTLVVKRSGPESTLQTIVRAVRRAQADKPEIQRFADAASEYFVPFVIAASLATFGAWLIFRQPFNEALMHAVTVLVVACPCALGLATPMAIVVSCGIAMKRGILVKKPSALEGLAGIKFLLMDKTGTITEGKPVVKTHAVLNAAQAPTVLATAFSMASRSIHPLSKALAEFLKDQPGRDIPFREFEERRGFGLIAATSEGTIWSLGSLSLLEESGIPLPGLPPEFQDESLTLVFLASGKKVEAVFGLADLPRPEASEAIAALRDLDISVVMVSGDREITAQSIGKAVGISEIRARVLPEGKLNVVREFLALGPTAFVGDGLNDAPALSAATVGLAIGSGADAAREATDLVLVGRDLGLLPFSIELSRATLGKIRQNLVWAVLYNVLMLPLASGLFIPILGPSYSVSPMLAGLAMAFSSVSVVLNSLLLRRHFN